jgi:hypothetical protein
LGFQLCIAPHRPLLCGLCWTRDYAEKQKYDGQAGNYFHVRSIMLIFGSTK